MYNCEYCERTFDTERGVKVHTGREHKDELQRIFEQENPFKCPYCDKRYDNYNSLSRHATRAHKLDTDQVYVDYYHDGEWPTCKCGCGERVNFRYGEYFGFAEFLQGHYARTLENGFWTEEGLEKSADTRREQYASGEREPWNKGLSIEENPDHPGLQKLREINLKENNPERARKISEALMGHEVSQETRDKIAEANREAWTDEMKEAQRLNRIEYHRNRQFNEPTLLEREFENICQSLDLIFEKQYCFGGYLWDFYFPKNDIFVEVHGDFYHCNPEKWPDGPEYIVQHDVTSNDQKKHAVLADLDKKLLIFWESDINDNRAKVVKKLLNEIEV